MSPKVNNKKLTARKAKEIAWRYIYSWASEAARPDTAFLEVQTEAEKAEYDIDNSQHREAIVKEFQRISALVFKKYSKFRDV